MRKKYNTPHRSRVVKTRLSEDEYAGLREQAQGFDPVQLYEARQEIGRAHV